MAGVPTEKRTEPAHASSPSLKCAVTDQHASDAVNVGHSSIVAHSRHVIKKSYPLALTAVTTLQGVQSPDCKYTSRKCEADAIETIFIGTPPSFRDYPNRIESCRFIGFFCGRTKMNYQHNGRAPYIPTPDEIRDACEQIRGKWSQDDERQRGNGRFCNDDEKLDAMESDAPSSPD